MTRTGRHIVGILAMGILLGPASASAGQVVLNGLAVGSTAADISVQSFQDRKFSTTIKQEYDFSCGSAALATLLLYTYHIPATETSVFAGMYLNGNQKEIREHGFSLLDMKTYLARHEIPSSGFRAPLATLAKIRVPAIVLINEHGYKHFVVFRGMRDGSVLLADPAIGLRSVSATEFSQQWTGIFFILLTDLPDARASFNNNQDWSGEPGAPLDISRFMVDLATLQQVTVPDSERF